MKFLDRSEDLERRCFRGSMKWVSTGCTTSRLSRESSQPEPRAAPTARLPTPSHQRLAVQLARPTPRPTRCNYTPRLPRRRGYQHHHTSVWLSIWPEPRPAPQDVTIDPGCPDGGATNTFTPASDCTTGQTHAPPHKM